MESDDMEEVLVPDLGLLVQSDALNQIDKLLEAIDSVTPEVPLHETAGRRISQRDGMLFSRSRTGEQWRPDFIRRCPHW